MEEGKGMGISGRWLGGARRGEMGLGKRGNGEGWGKNKGERLERDTR